MLSKRVSGIHMLYPDENTKANLFETSSLELAWEVRLITFGIMESGRELSRPSNCGIVSTHGLMTRCPASS